MEHDSLPKFGPGAQKKAFKSYMVGLIASILLTLASYFLVAERLLTGSLLIFTLLSLGVIQATIQLIFFLNLGREAKPRWNVLIFSFMALVVLILVLCSIWIMYTLSYRVMDVM